MFFFFFTAFRSCWVLPLFNIVNKLQVDRDPSTTYLVAKFLSNIFSFSECIIGLVIAQDHLITGALERYYFYFNKFSTGFGIPNWMCTCQECFRLILHLAGV